MKLTAKIIISILVAIVATALTTWLTGDSHAAPQLFVAFCGATVATALLVSIPRGGVAASTPATSTAGKTRQASKPASGNTSVSSTPRDGSREQGQVKWFNVSKGFGFITKEDGEEIFVHFRSIRGGGRRGLRDGQQVTFVVADSDKGPQAEDVEGLD